MTENDRVAFAAFASELSASLARLASALSGGEGRAVTGSTSSSAFGPASQNTPWNERLVRQSLIIKEIVDAGGSVPQSSWYQIAAKYGYTGRGVAGFFRSNSQGLLEMRKDRSGQDKVYVTKRGKERLAQNKSAVQTALDETQA
jgi:hypothetical protein